MNQVRLNRRQALKAGLGAAALTPLAAALHSEEARTVRKNNLHQSVCRWCYEKIPLDQLAAFAAQIGLKGIDLLQPEEYEFPRRYGLICTMAYAGAGDIPNGLNRSENHAAIEAGFRTNIPLAAKAGIPNVIVFSGNRRGMGDEEGARNTVAGLNRVKKIAEDNGVTICLELLNSKHDHHDYMCDHTSWGVRVVEEVNSPNVKLLYDIYHMQIMEGDVIRTIRDNHQYIGHYHTGGIPGRKEIDDTQELNYHAVAKAIADTGYQGYFAHEFLPTRDWFESLKQAVQICTV
jgi:hydroxypyruvate isomerase